uniref:Uncharacterized protein n=1 Tax=Ciona savignyi TaxID=51511 RepID=H2Y757_CIOSA
SRDSSKNWELLAQYDVTNASSADRPGNETASKGRPFTGLLCKTAQSLQFPQLQPAVVKFIHLPKKTAPCLIFCVYILFCVNYHVLKIASALRSVLKYRCTYMNLK